MTPIEKQQNFYKELKALLIKYDAEIIIDKKIGRYFDGYIISVEFNYDDEMFHNHGTGIIPPLDLGSYEDGL